MPRLKLASRSAGWKLTAIILLLLVPIATLLYFVTGRALSEIRLVERQFAGAVYLEKVLTVYGRVAAGVPPAAGETEQLQRVPSLLTARQRSLDADAAHIAGQLRAAKAADAAHLWPLRGLIHDAALSSDLLLDTARDRQSLANAVAAHLPDLAALVRRSAGGNGRVAEGEFALLRNAAFLTVSEAIKSDASGRLSANLNDALLAFHTSADHYATALRVGGAAATGAEAQALIVSINALTGASLRALSSRIEEHGQSLRSGLLAVLAGVGAASAAALGFALHLVAATFHKLDVVEAARQRLAQSEAEARAHASEMQAMNARVAGLNNELTRNYRALQDAQEENIRKSKMAQLGALTAMVAHELRNPLGAVRNSAFHIEALSRKGGFNVNRQTERISAAVVRCDAIITQLLDYAASKDIRVQKLTVSEWLPEVLGEEAKNLPGWLEIDCSDGTDGAAVMADPLKLRQAAGNILLNAAQAMAPQQALAGFPGARVQVSTNRRDGGVEIVIADKGPGIPTDKLPQVTEPLFTTKSFGPGLGLAIADQVVKLHSGRLKIESEEGRGTAVSIWLPLAEAMAEAA